MFRDNNVKAQMKDEDVYCTYTYTYNAVLLCLGSIMLFFQNI